MLHSTAEPGCDCSGSIVRTRLWRGHQRLYSCDRCLQFGIWSDGFKLVGTSHLRQVLEQRRRAAEAEGRIVRIKLQVQLKEGRPNYGSAGAGAEVEFEVPDQVAGTGEFQALVEGRYNLLQREVERQLGRMGTVAQTQQTQQPEIRPERPAAAPPPRRDDRAPVERNGAGGYQDRVPLGPGPRPTAQPGPQRDDPPQTGGQLLGWAYNHSCGEELKSLAKAWQIPGPIKAWSRDDVIAAYNELSRARAQWGGH